MNRSREATDWGLVLFHCVKPEFHHDGTTERDRRFAKATGCDVENPRVFAKTTGFSRRRQFVCAPSSVSSGLAVWSTKVRAALALGWHARSFQRRAWWLTRTHYFSGSPHSTLNTQHWTLNPSYHKSWPDFHNYFRPGGILTRRALRTRRKEQGADWLTAES
jgi:hypothetical protein